MKTQLKILTILGLLFAQISSMVLAGHAGNNGGDHVRATFLRMGQAVISYLRETNEGQQIVASHQLDLLALEGVLNINTLEVVDGLLLDNGGSIVDATGEPGKIKLSSIKWMDHFESDRDVYFLVFHEMLRGVGVNDDNYIISKSINPFPQSRRIITRTTSRYPLLGVASLVGVVDPNAIRLEGEGCPAGLAGTYIEFDAERNTLDLTFSRYTLAAGSSLPTAARKACSIVIPYKPTNGSRLKVTQLDFSAKAELQAGAKAAINAAITSGSTITKSSSFNAQNAIQGKLMTRFGNVYESDCMGTPGLLSIRTAAALQVDARTAPQFKPSLLTADRLSVSIMIERCTAATN
jgi:hypothetical protein